MHSTTPTASIAGVMYCSGEIVEQPDHEGRDRIGDEGEEPPSAG